MTWGQALNKVKYELLMLLALVGYATQYYLEVRGFSGRQINLLLVEPVYWVLVVCSVLLVIQKIKAAKSSVRSESTESDLAPQALNSDDRRRFYRQAAAFSVTTLLYVLALSWFGFVTASFLYLAILTYLLGARGVWLTLVLPACVVGFLYVSMVVLLRFSLPQGILI
ncbi:MAG: tripartite tricarboxylate transporter TctB family protein [Burkholderiaceae bacterium]|nr:tripartite tricarboxylate transporter TctB family protein [Burkholderiaceae bacterium]MCD8517049.1 tripartite tricarboxylate transporter TctB family protein [Burkholderiaceae bacterium]MCD8536904.1 tripartite tricarboxylate transporter TctB family protein [Burkholderiaceae bacterium]MCD8566070.1 tripartite tricarboxylate transporter TctB family protein [Burkholderiaceae bacterium]